MSSGDRDRVEGKLEEGKGNLKQAWGDVTGDDKLKAEGKMDEAKGEAQGFLGDIKNKLEDMGDDVRNAVEMPRMMSSARRTKLVSGNHFGVSGESDTPFSFGSGIGAAEPRLHIRQFSATARISGGLPSLSQPRTA